MTLNVDALVNAVCANPAHFAIQVTYAPKTGPSFTINGIFDEAVEELNLVKETAPVTTVHPALGVQLSTFPTGVTPLQGDQVTINATLFNVIDVRVDGFGWAALELMLAS